MRLQNQGKLSANQKFCQPWCHCWPAIYIIHGSYINSKQGMCSPYTEVKVIIPTIGWLRFRSTTNIGPLWRPYLQKQFTTCLEKLSIVSSGIVPSCTSCFPCFPRPTCNIHHNSKTWNRKTSGKLQSYKLWGRLETKVSNNWNTAILNWMPNTSIRQMKEMQVFPTLEVQYLPTSPNYAEGTHTTFGVIVPFHNY